MKSDFSWTWLHLKLFKSLHLHKHYYNLFLTSKVLLTPGQQSGHSASCNTFIIFVVYSVKHSHTPSNMTFVTYPAGLDSSWCRRLHPRWASGKTRGCPDHGGRSRRNRQSDRTPGCWRRPARTFKDLKGLLVRQHRQNTLWCVLTTTRESVSASGYVCVAMRTYW